MSSDFNHVIYDYYNRESNKVAHELAMIVNFSPPSIWMNSAPDVLLTLLVKDATIFFEHQYRGKHSYIRAYTYLYEHLRETEPACHLEI